MTLGLMKHFIHTLWRRNSRGFDYIVEKLSKITQIKLQEGIFVKPLIKKALKDIKFKKTLDQLQLPTLNAFYWIFAKTKILP